MAEMPDGWQLEGLWHDGNYSEGHSFADSDIGQADALIVSYDGSGNPDSEHFQPHNEDGREYVTIHGADDYEALCDLIADYDTDSYFG